jgi:hypothetical protein
MAAGWAAVACGLGALWGLLPGCQPVVLDFHPVIVKPEETCPADPSWLTDTQDPDLATPAPHPLTECPFYQVGFHYFLLATRPDLLGEPGLADCATPDDLFKPAHPLPDGALAPDGIHRGTALRAWLTDVRQPGTGAILIDRDHHPLYYGTHIDHTFFAFAVGNGLDTAAGIQAANPSLSLPEGIVEARSVWKDIDPADGVAFDASRYITTHAWVPTLNQDPSTGAISADRDHPRQIRVALVALHIAFTLRGHPEMIWTTFEHRDESGVSDVAPNLAQDPDSPGIARLGMTAAVAPADGLLYRAGTPASRANQPLADIALTLDETTQTLTPDSPVYRVFPASHSNTNEESQALLSLNQEVAALFEGAAGQQRASDPRRWYRLVGGIWLDKPGFFSLDAGLQNDDSSPFVTGPHVDESGVLAAAVPAAQFAQAMSVDGTDSPYSIVGGCDRLSSTAIESFTQGPASLNNCFACHNTHAISFQGIPLPRDAAGGSVLLAPKLINVSRIFARFLADECAAGATCP